MQICCRMSLNFLLDVSVILWILVHWLYDLYSTSVKACFILFRKSHALRLLQGSTFVLGGHARQSPCDGFQGRDPQTSGSPFPVESSRQLDTHSLGWPYSGDDDI